MKVFKYPLEIFLHAQLRSTCTSAPRIYLISIAKKKFHFGIYFLWWNTSYRMFVDKGVFFTFEIFSLHFHEKFNYVTPPQKRQIYN